MSPGAEPGSVVITLRGEAALPISPLPGLARLT
jgi:hypothetical protein